MKSNFRMFIGSAILLTAVAASGQISKQVRATVPFSFMAGEKRSPAGDYTVGFDRNQSYLTLSSDNFKIFILPTSTSAGGDNRSFLRFNRYGDQWFLQAVSFSGTAEIAPVGKHEQELIMANKPSGRPIIADIAVH